VYGPGKWPFWSVRLRCSGYEPLDHALHADKKSMDEQYFHKFKWFMHRCGARMRAKEVGLGKKPKKEEEREETVASFSASPHQMSRAVRLLFLSMLLDENGYES
jgi:hypothetical protein